MIQNEGNFYQFHEVSVAPGEHLGGLGQLRPFRGRCPNSLGHPGGYKEQMVPWSSHCLRAGQLHPPVWRTRLRMTPHVRTFEAWIGMSWYFRPLRTNKNDNQLKDAPETQSLLHNGLRNAHFLITHTGIIYDHVASSLVIVTAIDHQQ